MIWITHQKEKNQYYFFGASFLTMATKKKIWCKVYKQLFFRKLVQKPPCFEETNSQKSSYLDHESLEVDRTKWYPKNSYFAGLPLARFGSFLLWMITHPPT
jgi:hypothetical protein